MGAVGKMLISPVAAMAGLLDKPKVTAPVAQPQAIDRSNTVVMDAVAARRGSLANKRTGSLGAEVSGGKKTSLGG
ncbi:hypothetical protein [Novosphingobium clariflavum]|uniref:Uncharacterized protein n=1 Tax=Novosphingobium clariflavum TaxID=2029884 RepID=A0ABV6S1W0_9SPHN|nr:hypothetical protein [Novosphingobium clariflavum]